MRTCPNCGTTITCGCQDKVANDGKRVCSKCVSFYNQSLVQPPPPATFDQILQEAKVYFNLTPDENSSKPQG